MPDAFDEARADLLRSLLLERFGRVTPEQYREPASPPPRTTQIREDHHDRARRRIDLARAVEQHDAHVRARNRDARRDAF